MRTWVKRSAIGLVLLVAAAAAAVVIAVQLGDRKLVRRVELPVAVAPVAYADDAASRERGAYLFRSRGCSDCHGLDGSGHVVVSDGALHVRAPDITPGATTVAKYTPLDWVRAIRHGVKPDDRPIFLMPSEDYNRLTDTDLAAVVAYTRSLPARGGEAGTIRLPLPVKALYALGVVRDASEKIDHRLPPSQPVPEAVSAAHGAYVANSCIGCHRADLKGGKIAGAPPSWPAAPRIVRGDGSVLPRYASVASFQAMLKSGKRPDGTEIQVMPFAALREMSDVDVRALYLHLTTTPP